MTNLSQVYRDIPIHLHRIIPLDFESVQTLPDSHSWPPINDSKSSVLQLVGDSSIPIIDLTDLNVIERVAHACETWGMFQVTNHGVPSSLLDELESEVCRLFALPRRQKTKALRSPSGATGYGTARMAQFLEQSLWQEGFTIMGSSVDHAKELWPDDYERFCETMDKYQEKMKALAHHLLMLILKSLDICEEEVMWAASLPSSSNGALQLHSYPCCPDPNRAMGLAPHTDTMLLTIVHQSGANGLQVFKDDAGWVSVSPRPGTLVVSAGDLLHILSNAQYSTAYHRVMVNQDRHRYSVAYFYGPPVESVIVPVCKADCPRYRTLTVKEYILVKGKHFDKALSLIQI